MIPIQEKQTKQNGLKMFIGIPISMELTLEWNALHILNVHQILFKMIYYTPYYHYCEPKYRPKGNNRLQCIMKCYYKKRWSILFEITKSIPG